MKQIVFITVFFISLVFHECMAQKKVQPNFPKEMLPHVKVEYMKQFDVGQVLWNINCAKCHNTKLGNKEIVPNFSEGQLIGYELRVLNPEHESEIPETSVSAEELGLIMVFLRYKKKSVPK